MEVISTDMLIGYLQRNKRLFEELLPELIKKLIFLESPQGKVRIPSINDIWAPGFDGIVQQDATSKHVLKGTSYWELGTQKNYISKINSDYNKRTLETDEQTRKDTAFYLVTPYIWARKETISEWESTHNGWAKTIIYDGVALVDWINSQPSICAWLMSEFGESNVSFSTVKDAWDQFSNKTSPAFVDSVFLHERDNEKDQLIAAVNQKHIIRVKSDFYYDSIGFVLASLLADSYLRESAIVVNDYDTYTAISSIVSGKILLLNFYCDANLNNNNHTIVCYGKRACSIDADISIPPRRRRQVEHGLVEMGIKKETATELYRKTHGNLRALIRIIPGTANEPVPEWAIKSDLHLLYPLLFLESISRTNDCALVELLSQEKYETIEEKYLDFARSEDTPVKVVGDYFIIVNFEEVWNYLCPRPEDIHFKRLTDTIKNISDRKLSVDCFHRRGSIEQQLLSILICYSYEHSDSAKFANAIECILSKRSKANKTIYENLHLFAEAAPEKTMAVIEADVKNAQSYLYYALENNCYSSYLSALEELSLHESTAYQACSSLYRLAQIEKEYLYSNTPYTSLSNTLAILNTYSALTVDDKVIMLKKCIDDNSKWGSKFVSDTICADHFYRCERIGIKAHDPFETLTYKKYYDAVFELALYTVDSCNKSGFIDPVITLVNHYWLFTMERLTVLADKFEPSSYSNDDIVKINSILRNKICYVEDHESRQKYSDAFSHWILHTSTDDPIIDNAWAFSNYYDCPDISLNKCYADLDNGQTYDFRVNLLSSIRKHCDSDKIAQLAYYMDNCYGWGRVINSLSEPQILMVFCMTAKETNKYSLLAGCMDYLVCDEFTAVLDSLNSSERQSVLPVVCRRDFLSETVSEENLFFYWSNKTMTNYNEFEYRALLKYNPCGLLYYCRKESETSAEGMINTIIEVFDSIARFESNQALPTRWTHLIQAIIASVDEIYYSNDWALLCMKIQDLHLIEDNSEGINRYLFYNPDILIDKYKKSFGFYSGFRLPSCALDNYEEFKEFIDYLIQEEKTYYAAQIIGQTLIDDKEFPLVVMDYLEQYSEADFDRMIAGCISSTSGFTWISDGTNQRHKADKYSNIAKSIDANHYHAKFVFITLSRIYSKESDNEDIYGELY